jgi:hypothetical protein
MEGKTIELERPPQENLRYTIRLRRRPEDARGTPNDEHGPLRDHDAPKKQANDFFHRFCNGHCLLDRACLLETA